ncbi:MAG: 50S ribosomal protein L4, partial [Thermoanaerobaculia bacterium]
GRARAGTRRSPLWRGGGIIFGPHPRDYSFSIPKKKRRLAVRSALFAKLKDREVVVVDGLKLEKPQTKQLAGALRALGIRGRCLLGTAAVDPTLVLSARNIPGLRILPVAEFTALEILAARTVLLTREALEKLLGDSGAGPQAAPAQGAVTEAGAAPGGEPREAGS